MGIKQSIRLKQAAIMQNRALIASNSSALKTRTLRALATPPALAGSFGIGFFLAMLRRPKSQEPVAQTKHQKRQYHWLQLLLREAAVPLVLGILQNPPASTETATAHHDSTTV